MYPSTPSPFQPINFRSDLPLYPHLLQALRVTGGTVSGPSGFASSSVLGAVLYVAFTQQLRDNSLIPRDREPCFVLDLNGTTLLPGYYLGRLAGSYQSLPVYEVVAYTRGLIIGEEDGSPIGLVTTILFNQDQGFDIGIDIPTNTGFVTIDDATIVSTGVVNHGNQTFASVKTFTKSHAGVDYNISAVYTETVPSSGFQLYGISSRSSPGGFDYSVITITSRSIEFTGYESGYREGSIYHSYGDLSFYPLQAGTNGAIIDGAFRFSYVTTGTPRYILKLVSSSGTYPGAAIFGIDSVEGQTGADAAGNYFTGGIVTSIGGFSGTITIGSTSITGGTPGYVLIVDGSSKLGQSNTISGGTW